MVFGVSGADLDVDDSISLYPLTTKVTVPKLNLLDRTFGYSFRIEKMRGGHRVAGLVQQTCGNRILSDIAISKYRRGVTVTLVPDASDKIKPTSFPSGERPPVLLPDQDHLDKIGALGYHVAIKGCALPRRLTSETRKPRNEHKHTEPAFQKITPSR